MRKWQDLAAPDDPESWCALSGMWPNSRGAYETADVSAISDTFTVSLMDHLAHAFAYGVNSGAEQEYAVYQSAGNNLHVLEWDGTTLTDRLTVSATGTVRGAVSMARFNNAALIAFSCGSAKNIYAATAFGQAFAAVAGSPTDQNILVVQSNAVLAFKTGSNIWYASDVGDYTNWATGEYATGTLYGGAGAVSAAVAHGGDVYVFKPGSIHRMTYVGGSTIKWQNNRVLDGWGVPTDTALNATHYPVQDWVLSTPHGIVFYGGGGLLYLWDTVGEPRCINRYTTIPVESISGVLTYDPFRDTLCVAPSLGSSATGTAYDGTQTIASLYYYYNFQSNAWGSGYGSAGELATAASLNSGVLRGNWYNRADQTSSKPVFWSAIDNVAGTLKRVAPTGPTTGSSYLQTAKVGRPDHKTRFNRVIPLLRSRVDTPTQAVVSLTLDLFREREDTTAQSTRTITESSARKRFDLQGDKCVDNYARFKVTWTASDVEVDDFLIDAKPAGAE